MKHKKILSRNERVEKAIKRSIDAFMMKEYQKVEHRANASLAKAVMRGVEKYLATPNMSYQVLLLDYDKETDGYKNPRIVNESFCSPEEALYPIDPKTGEPVAEAIADVAWHLPDIDCVPEI